LVIDPAVFAEQGSAHFIYNSYAPTHLSPLFIRRTTRSQLHSAATVAAMDSVDVAWSREAAADAAREAEAAAGAATHHAKEAARQFALVNPQGAAAFEVNSSMGRARTRNFSG